LIDPVSSLIVALATLRTTSLYLDRTSRGPVFSVTLASISTRLVPSLRSFIFKRGFSPFSTVSLSIVFGAVSACVLSSSSRKLSLVNRNRLSFVGKSRVSCLVPLRLSYVSEDTSTTDISFVMLSLWLYC